MKLFSLRKLGAALSALVFSGLLAYAATNLSLDGNLSVGGTTTLTGATTHTGLTTVGRVGTTGTIPVVSVCGTSSAIATGSTDTAGRITVGTSASNACTLTFSAAFTAAPVCVVQNMTTGAAANVYAVSTTAIVWSSALADSTVLVYHCIALGS